MIWPIEAGKDSTCKIALSVTTFASSVLSPGLGKNGLSLIGCFPQSRVPFLCRGLVFEAVLSTALPIHSPPSSPKIRSGRILPSQTEVVVWSSFSLVFSLV
jgi:hypothetical protein